MPFMTPFEFGDIILVPFPFTDQSTTKKRPAVVISSTPYNQERPDLIIMAVTSQIKPASIIGEVIIQNWQTAGLLVATATKSGNLRPATRGIQVFGRWATRRVCSVDDAQLGALLRGASVPWEGDRGVRLLHWRGTPVGLGVVRAGQLVGQLPRNVTEHLQLGRMEMLC